MVFGSRYPLRQDLFQIDTPGYPRAPGEGVAFAPRYPPKSSFDFAGLRFGYNHPVMLNLDELANRLSRVEHFCNLSLPEVKEIISTGRIHRYPQGVYLLLEEDISSDLFVLLSGRIQLCRLGPQGQVSILAIFEPVLMFNEVAALDGGPAPVTVIALEETITWQLSSTELEQMILLHPRIGLGMLQVLAGRNRRLISHFEDLSFRTVVARAAKLLLELSQAGTQPIDRRKHPNHQLAARIATVPEAFSRALKSFKTTGIVQATTRQILVDQPNRLEEISSSTPWIR